MSDVISIRLSGVTKSFRARRPFGGGLKSMVLHFPESLRSMRHAPRFCALDDVSLEIRKGECVSVIGRNGAGKSTILGLIAGVLDPDRGRIEARGRICPLLELGAGFHAELTGRENIVLNGVLLGMTRREVAAQLDAIIDFSELHDFVDSPLRTFSSGMVARLGFSVAVHLSPDILLVDEVLAVGDVAFRTKCLERIRTFRERGVTIVFVTHNVREAACLGDRVLIFSANPGQIREEFRINLPRPRDINSVELAAYTTEITRALKGHLSTSEVLQ